MSTLRLLLVSLTLATSHLARAQKINAAAFGPPPDSDPLTWGFYGTHEIQQPTELEVEGNFPKWLTGSLYRGAMGTWDMGNFTAEHWFDGFSRNHRFEIANGSVTYRSRNASDELMDFVREHGKIPDGTFGSDPCKIIFGAFEITFRDGVYLHGNKSSANINVVPIINSPDLARNTTSVGSPVKNLVSTTEQNTLQQIDPVTLEPIELFSDQVANQILNERDHSAAHPAMIDGTRYNYVLDPSAKPPVYRIYGIEPTGKSVILANITDAPPAYLHSIFNTDKHLILVIWQADYVRPGKTYLSSMGPWNPDRKTLFYVVNKDKPGVVAKYASPDAWFAFHQVNSFEDESGAINIDLPRMPNYDFLKAAMVPSLRKNLGNPGHSKQDLAGTFARYRLPPLASPADARYSNGTLKVHQAEIAIAMSYQEANIELPQINTDYAGKPYRYAYGIHVDKPGYFSDSLIKIDTHTQTSKIWTPRIKSVPSEPIFVSSPRSDAEEDDGVLLTVAMDSAAKRSSLVVLNATTMVEMGRARMPIVMGYGFHGVWA